MSVQAIWHCFCGFGFNKRMYSTKLWTRNIHIIKIVSFAVKTQVYMHVWASTKFCWFFKWKNLCCKLSKIQLGLFLLFNEFTLILPYITLQSSNIFLGHLACTTCLRSTDRFLMLKLRHCDKMMARQCQVSCWWLCKHDCSSKYLRLVYYSFVLSSTVPQIMKLFLSTN